jgi:hypothetical protein
MPKEHKDEATLRSTPGPCATALALLGTALVFAPSRLSVAATVDANSPSYSDVAGAIASVMDGDTVTIPAGTATWSRTLRVAKGITIQGAGVGVTIIKDSLQNGRLIDWTLAAGYPSRLTGIEFQDGGRINGGGAPGGVLHVDGSNTDGSMFRWDNCKWNNVNGAPVLDTVVGVVDHCAFITDKFGNAIYIYSSRWNDQNNGDGSWAAPTGFGSSQFLFIEDCSFSHTQPSLHDVTDAYAGARFVVRHCTIFNGGPHNHGTESTGRARGSRAMEVYNNTYTGTDLNRFVGGSRSGGVLFHDNSISGYGAAPVFTLVNVRNYMPFTPWGGADGSNAWDVNERITFFTGKAASNSSNLTVAVSGAKWTTNQWAGYVLYRTSNVCNSGSLNYGEIQSNTSTTITFTGNGGYQNPPSMSICAGDTLEIRKVDHALDQCGRAGGSLITGDPPVRPAAWNDQVTEPCYSWNNRSGNTEVNFSPGPGVRANVHFFNNTPMPGYTPYVYPHPLTKGLPPPEQITRKLKGNSQDNLRKERRPWGGRNLDRKKAKKPKEGPTNEMADGQNNPGN